MSSVGPLNWASAPSAESYWYWQWLSNYYSYYLNYMWYSSYQGLNPNIRDTRQTQPNSQRQTETQSDADRKALEQQWLEYFQQQSRQWSDQQPSNESQAPRNDPRHDPDVVPSVARPATDDVTRQERHSRINFQYSFQRMYEIRPASLLRRTVAASVDFLIVSVLQYLIYFYVLEMPMRVPLAFTLLMSGNSIESLDEETLLDDIESLSYSMGVYLMTVLLYESVFNAGGVPPLGGGTPGKRMMGLCVIRCETTHIMTNGRVAVSPGGPLGMVRSSIRAVFKNMSQLLFLPMFVTMFMTRSRRTAYDVMSGSIVVVQPSTIVQQQQQR